MSCLSIDSNKRVALIEVLADSEAILAYVPEETKNVSLDCHLGSRQVKVCSIHHICYRRQTTQKMSCTIDSFITGDALIQQKWALSK